MTNVLIVLISVFFISTLYFFIKNLNIQKKNNYLKAKNSYLKNKYKLFHTLFESNPVAMVACNNNDIALETNKKFLHLTGFSSLQEAGNNNTIYDLFEEDKNHIKEKGDKTELSLKAKDKKTLNISLKEIPLSNNKAKRETDISTIYCLFKKEISKNDQFDHSKNKLQTFFDKSPISIVLIDLKGTIQTVNHSFLDLIGKKSDETNNKHFFDFVVDQHKEDVLKQIEIIKSSSDKVKTIECKLKGDPEKTVTLFANRFFDDHDKLAGIIYHILDVSERIELEARFSQSQKMQAIGQLAGGIAHDFNNLLTAMIGFCDLLLLRHKPGEQSFADTMQIKQNANRAANLVRQLLAFSRQQTMKPSILDITDVLSEISYLIRRLIGVDIELKISHSRDLTTIKVDKVQFEQVIINLAVNARDAMTSGGVLSIKTKNVVTEEKNKKNNLPKGKYVHIAVKDTGIGIPKENLNRIFDPFFSTKEIGSGTGLGLSTVYGIVKQSGGFIFVNSIVNKGTTFDIFFPQNNEKDSSSNEQNQTEKKTIDLTGIGTILFVEDEDAVRLFGARALKNKGYSVLEAESGEKALEVIEKTSERIDLVITDLVMPEMDGSELVKIIRKDDPNVPIICISGYAEDTIRKKLTFDDKIHFLPKPFSLKVLASTVKEMLEK